MENRNMERKLRYVLKKAGYELHKSRVKNIHANNLGGYMITDLYNNCVVAGARYELDLDDVAGWAQE